MAANVVEGYQYDAFGRVWVFDGSWALLPDATGSILGNPYTYTGRRLDHESSLLHYRSRYLDTSQGRFLQRDPDGDAGNWYTFVGNGPWGGLNPFGLLTTATVASGGVGPIDVTFAEGAIVVANQGSVGLGVYEVNAGSVGFGPSSLAVDGRDLLVGTGSGDVHSFAVGRHGLRPRRVSSSGGDLAVFQLTPSGDVHSYAIGGHGLRP